MADPAGSVEQVTQVPPTGDGIHNVDDDTSNAKPKESPEETASSAFAKEVMDLISHEDIYEALQLQEEMCVTLIPSFDDLVVTVNVHASINRSTFSHYTL